MQLRGECRLRQIGGPACARGFAGSLNLLPNLGEKNRGAAPVFRSDSAYGSAGVFSAKYSWLSALSRAFVGLLSARLLAAV